MDYRQGGRGSTGTIDEEEEERREGKNPAKITFWCFQMSALLLVRSKFRSANEIRPPLNTIKNIAKAKFMNKQRAFWERDEMNGHHVSGGSFNHFLWVQKGRGPESIWGGVGGGGLGSSADGSPRRFPVVAP